MKNLRLFENVKYNITSTSRGTIPSIRFDNPHFRRKLEGEINELPSHRII